MHASLLSVNVSRLRKIEHEGKLVATAIFKVPVEGRIALRAEQLEGDDQADRQNHGGPMRAAYAYADEDYAWWSQELGCDLSPGKFGENLTTAGIDVSGARIGERWRVGSALVQVTSPRVPCYKLAMTMGDPHFIKRFAQALRPGAYLSIVEEGEVAAGDSAEIVFRPDHHVTVAEMARLYFFDRKNIRRLLDAPELPESWRDWVIETSGG